MPTYPLQLTCLGVIVGSPFLALVFVALRIYTRQKLNVRLSWDDWLIVLPMILSFALILPSYKYVKMWHIGIHIWDVPWDSLEPNYNDDYIVLMAFNLINIPILPLVKASIIMLLLRAGSVIEWLKRTLYVILFFTIASSVIPWAIYIFVCPPLTGNTWKPRTFGGLHCLDRHRMGEMMIWITCANLITDILILPIPFVIIRKMMSTRIRSRLVVLVVFNCSMIVAGIGAAKIYLSYRDQLYALFNDDWTYQIRFCVNHIENNVAIILANIPILRGLVTRWVFSFKTQTSPLEREDPPERQWYSLNVSQPNRRSELMKKVMPSAQEKLNKSMEKHFKRTSKDVRASQRLSHTFISGEEFVLDSYETADFCEKGHISKNEEHAKGRAPAPIPVQTTEMHPECEGMVLRTPSLTSSTRRFSAATLLPITPVSPCRLKKIKDDEDDEMIGYAR